MGAEMNVGERVAQAFWVSILVMIPIFLWLYLGTPAHEGEPTRWQRLRAWFTDRYLTASVGADDDEETTVDDEVVRTTTRNNRVATPNNGDNRVLTDNEAATFQGKVQALAALIQAGKVGQAAGIELVFNCARSSRSDSPYQRARAALVPLLTPPPTGPQFPPLSEEQQALREALGLPHRP